MSRQVFVVKEESLYHVFQPICNIKEKKTLGYEAFIRSKDFKNPAELFYEAKKQEILYEIDILSIKNAIASFCPSTHEQLLFLNIFPSTLLNSKFPNMLEQLFRHYSAIQHRIVFELNEAKDEEMMWSNPEIFSVIATLKSFGCKIAIDDVGKGAASLMQIIELKPDYIKLDKYFSSQLASSDEKKRLISLFVQFYESSNLIIEGIETKEDLQLIKELNATYAQGYFLGKPKSLDNGSEKR